jgi:flagellar basal body-associated protein FliL
MSCRMDEWWHWIMKRIIIIIIIIIVVVVVVVVVLFPDSVIDFWLFSSCKYIKGKNKQSCPYA